MAKPKTGQVRLISGQWRGRKLSVPDLPGLRPTPDRVRETVFNWLAPYCHGARVLDLFSGSGALGFEAASRAAAEVILVDQNPEVVRQLKQQAQQFGAGNMRFFDQGAAAYLQQNRMCFDLIFLDPPYQHPQLRELLLKSDQWSNWHHQDTLIYTEWPIHEAEPVAPEGFSWWRQKQAASVAYGLWKKQ